MKPRILLGLTLLVIAALALGGALFYNSKKRQTPLIYSNKDALQNIWYKYKLTYLEPSSHRTMDKQNNYITTSEGESYTMLRAVWMDDQATYDSSWKWTKDNLGHSQDALFSWLFGQRADGSYGVIVEKSGNTTASDGDTDIALSLLLANQRWNQADYLTRAKEVINGIWVNDVVTVNGKPVMTADNLEKENPTQVVVNPSYFSPYAYRLFAQVDTDHDWKGLIDNTYAVLANSSSLSLDKSTSSGLPPNWVTMNRANGAIQADNQTAQLNTDYGYDAIRIPWRIALDYVWNQDSRDKNYLSTLSFLGTEWNKSDSLSTVYAHDGTVVTASESPAAYGANIGYFMVTDPTAERKLYDEKLATLYSSNKDGWETTLSYYDDNWAWFGMALAMNQLPKPASF